MVRESNGDRVYHSAVLTSRMTPVRAVLLFGLAAASWAVLLFVATCAASRADGSWWTRAGAAAVYIVGNVICHQQPERSFHLWATTMPVCARCAGIYLGAALISTMVLVSGRSDVGSGFRGGARSAPITLMLAATPAVASLIYEWTSGHTPSNTVRAATGVMLGGGVAYVILSAILSTAPASRTDAVN
jgi:uncharacterized membrane protein